MQQDRESEFIPTETSPASIDELMNEFELSDAEIEQRAQEYETENWSLVMSVYMLAPTMMWWVENVSLLSIQRQMFKKFRV